MRFRRLGLLLIVAAAAPGLTSCNSGDSLAGLGSDQNSSNSADAAFARAMAAHEAGARSITRLGERHAKRDELRGIAHTMTREESDDLRALLGRHGSRAVRLSASSAADLARVRHAVSFDYEFMAAMIFENQAAIAIARDEVRSGKDPALTRLAAMIASRRQQELNRIRAWLKLWYGEIQPSPAPAPGAPPRAAPAPPT